MGLQIPLVLIGLDPLEDLADRLADDGARLGKLRIRGGRVAGEELEHGHHAPTHHHGKGERRSQPGLQRCAAAGHIAVGDTEIRYPRGLRGREDPARKTHPGHGCRPVRHIAKRGEIPVVLLADPPAAAVRHHGAAVQPVRVAHGESRRSRDLRHDELQQFLDRRRIAGVRPYPADQLQQVLGR